MARLPFHIRHRSTRILEIVHSDVCGPINIDALTGKRYFVTFIDDFSNFTIIYLLSTKDEVTKLFKEYTAMVESKFNLKIHKFRCDNGGEYCSNDLRDFCKAKGTLIDYTIPYTKQLNGKAERKNRSIFDKVRAVMHKSGVPKYLWGEAVLFVNYTINRSPSRSLVGKTPYEVWEGIKPNVENLRVFGCTAYKHIPNELRTKTDFKAEKCVMTGYAPVGYRLYQPHTRSVVIAKDVIFNEKNFYFKEKISPDKEEDLKILDDRYNIFDEDITNTNSFDFQNLNSDNKAERLPVIINREAERLPVIINNEAERLPAEMNKLAERLPTKRTERLSNKNNTNMHDNLASLNNNPEEGISLRRSTRIANKLVHLADGELFLTINEMENKVPNSYQDIQGREDQDQWYKSVEREFDSIIKNKTWEPVAKPVDKEILDTKWVFKYKDMEKTDEFKYKARLVVRGFAQTQDFGYGELYSPVAKFSTLRLFLKIGVEKGMFLHHMDVKTAFFEW